MMLTRIEVPAIEQLQESSAPRDEGTANSVFEVLHGFYGNVFLSRYVVGQTENGEDVGISNARRMWGFGLREFDEATVKAALGRAKVRYLDFPPNLPQFLDLCRALRPRAVIPEGQALIPMGGQLRSRYARDARAIMEKHARRAAAIHTGARDLSPGLGGLKEAIASAVAAAGGDEAAELLRLDRVLPSEDA